MSEFIQFAKPGDGIDAVFTPPQPVRQHHWSDAEQRRRDVLDVALRVVPYDAFAKLPVGQWEAGVERAAAFVERFINGAGRPAPSRSSGSASGDP